MSALLPIAALGSLAVAAELRERPARPDAAGSASRTQRLGFVLVVTAAATAAVLWTKRKPGSPSMLDAVYTPASGPESVEPPVAATPVAASAPVAAAAAAPAAAPVSAPRVAVPTPVPPVAAPFTPTGPVPVGSVARAMVGLSEDARNNASIVERLFRAAGYSNATIAAALVNAYMESGLSSTTKRGDSGNSVGLFQANMKAGAGKGYTAEQLQDPTFNTKVILQVEKRAIDRIEAEVRNGADFVTATGRFTQWVERPQYKDTTDKWKREAKAKVLFPSGVPRDPPPVLV